MRWVSLPLWLKISTLIGLAGLVADLVPFGFHMPLALIPAGVFGLSVGALVVYGRTR